MKISILAIALLTATASAQTCHYRTDGQYKLPDARCTPGQANPALIADPSGKPHMMDGHEANLCAKDFRTGPWRKVDESEKKKACAEYGITKGCPGPGYELDHLISLTDGGSDDILNLWPQPWKQARTKDVMENWIHRQICSGAQSLKGGQDSLAIDWYRAYLQMKNGVLSAKKSEQ